MEETIEAKAVKCLVAEDAFLQKRRNAGEDLN